MWYLYGILISSVLLATLIMIESKGDPKEYSPVSVLLGCLLWPILLAFILVSFIYFIITSALGSRK